MEKERFLSDLAKKELLIYDINVVIEPIRDDLEGVDVFIAKPVDQ